MCHVHNVKTTILHLPGPNQLDLTYSYNSRAERATGNDGKLIEEVLVSAMSSAQIEQCPAIIDCYGR